MKWNSLRIYAVDIGSVPGKNFGWAESSRKPSPKSNSSIEALVEALAHDLHDEKPVSLGFEAPIFVPVPEDSRELGKRRVEDPKDRAWSAGAGAAVMSTGVAQITWIIRWLVQNAEGPWTSNVTVNWSDFSRAGAPGLFLWEAMVTGDAKASKSDPLHNSLDAKKAVESFDRLKSSGIKRLENETGRSGPHFSLVGAALAANGLGGGSAIKTLSAAPVVVRA